MANPGCGVSSSGIQNPIDFWKEGDPTKIWAHFY